MSSVLRDQGRNIRQQRRQAGLTQKQLAEAADLHENYVSRLETGEQEPGLFVLLRLCRALSITPGKLLEDLTVSRLRRLRLR